MSALSWRCRQYDFVQWRVEQCAVLDVLHGAIMSERAIGHVPSSEYSNFPRVCCIPLPPLMRNRDNKYLVSKLEPVVDEEQGQGMGLSFVSVPSVADHQNQGPGESNFSDASETLFSMYLRRASERTLRWQIVGKGTRLRESLRELPFFSYNLEL